MEVFSPFGFKFGILLFFCICFGNLVYSWLCISFQVRIEKFALLFDSWDKYFFKKKIGSTEYILGWLPFGGYIKVFGMVKDESEIDTMLEEEKKYALIYKPKIQQQIFRASPYIIWIFLFLLFIYLINPSTPFFSNLEQILQYLTHAFKAMFGIATKASFEKYSTDVSSSFQLLPFSLLISCSAFIILSPLSSFMQMFAESKNSKMLKALGTVLTILVFYLVFWKLPSFAFSFFSFGNVLRYFSSAVIGIYTASFFTYWLIIPIIKLNKAI